MKIPTKTKTIIAEEPYLIVYALDKESGWFGKWLTLEDKVRSLRDIDRSISRHVDEVGATSLVVRYVTVCEYCENDATDCDQVTGEPCCCDEAVEEWTNLEETKNRTRDYAVLLKAIDLKNASGDFEDLSWSDMYDSDQKKFLYLARKALGIVEKEEENGS